ncbi:hypothetical protein RFI_20516 [Reticulomyxa filosa]|uniref:Uncharacterized protein n=1 Tax=Reticulomyxa filosa TaxID=46433 RepID=X6MTP5_RETFI|nr:hypothetical protein RFI_20516 [Reticulomyxa filosa]|eukprot:ETO16822.1 hypothetical protein RFI_20516 [Reticulomyxa filosa]
MKNGKQKCNNFEHMNDQMGTFTIGNESVDLDSEVEFYVRWKVDRNGKAREHAIHITRPGGKLMRNGRNDETSVDDDKVYEDEVEKGEKDEEKKRQEKNEMERKANIATKQSNDSSSLSMTRRKGYMYCESANAVKGTIVALDNSNDVFDVHADDCHMIGKHVLTKFMLVEFTPCVRKQRKATHVTGINKALLKHVSSNFHLSLSLCNLKLNTFQSQKHVGQVWWRSKSTPWFLIKPTLYSSQVVWALKRDIRAMNVQDINIKDFIEFRALDKNASDQSETNLPFQQAYDITAGGGYPVVAENGAYGEYLLRRIHLWTRLDDQPLCPLTTDTLLFHGWVSTWDVDRQTGTIEVEAPRGKRYRRIHFDLSNAILNKDVATHGVFLCVGHPVSFNIRSLQKDIKTQFSSPLSQEAFNVTSKGLSRVEPTSFPDISF